MSLAEMREKERMELYRLGIQILRLTEALIETISESEEVFIAHYREWMIENAMKIPPKIAGAGALDDIILLTEQATIIKLAARDLLTQTSGLAMFGYDEQDYLMALRSEIELFRHQFVRWVRTFPVNDMVAPDGWGLYYSEADVDLWNKANPEDPASE